MDFFLILVVAALLISTSSNAHFAPLPVATGATTYYVSADLGNDNNDGRSPEKAWQHVSKIFLKSMSRDPFQAGDSILLKRGEQWHGQIRLQATGNAQHPVRIGAYGDGPKPALFGDNPHTRWEPVAGHAGIYTTDIGGDGIPGVIFLDGRALKMISPTSALQGGEEAEPFLALLRPGTLAGRMGGRLWVRMPEGKELPDLAMRIFRAAGVSVVNSSYVEIENLDIERFNTGIDINESQYVVVRHNDIQDVLGIGIYLRWGGRDCLIESNTVFHSGNTALYALKGSNDSFRDNWVSYPHSSVLGIRVSGDKMGIGLQESQHSLVEYNYFSHSGGLDFYHEEGSVVRYNYLYRVWSAGSPNGDSLSVYGNIYNLGAPPGKRGSTGVNVGVTGPGTIAVFNNTILNASSYFLMGSSNDGKIIFSDNIVSATTAVGAMTSFGSNVESEHNCFFATGGPLFMHFKAKFTSLKAYQEESGLDLHSIYADPQFAAATPITPLDFLIQSGSGCISKASEIPSFDRAGGRTYDHASNSAGSPVIGAFRVDDGTRRRDVLSQSCTSHCFDHRFAVGPGVYLVRLTFATAALSRQAPFNFVLNGRTFDVEFDAAGVAESDDPLIKYFLVRPDGNLIVLASNASTDTALITEVNILHFDTNHGDGPQAISW